MNRSIVFIVFLLFLSFSGIAQQKYPREANTVRVMSYNIRNAVGLDQKRDYARIARIIEEVAPDVVALQELDSATLRSKGDDVLKKVADECMMYRTFAPAISHQGGKYGVGVLSKERPLACRYLSLPGREEKRALLLVEFKEYLFCCTHFSLTEEDQLASVPLILAELEQIRKPVFLAGDLNALPESATIRLLKGKFQQLTGSKNATYPADKPTDCIDYIFGYTGNGRAYTAMQNRVLNEPMASDHRPLFTDIRVKALKSDIFRTQPYLQNPTNGGITVSWLTHVPVYSWVEYGTDQSNLQKVHRLVDGQVISNNYIHKIRLSNLRPGTTYYYRVCSREIAAYAAYSKDFGETAQSDVFSFRTPTDKSADFTALFFNDLHKQEKTMLALQKQFKDLKYDFVVFNGDCIDDPKNEDDAVRALSFFNHAVGAEQVPVFYLRGNHEIRNAYSIELRDLLDYVGDKTYGAFSWGNTRFVMLDCGEDKPDNSPVYYGLNDFSQLLQDQVGFLKNELASKAFKKADKRVLMHHIPLFGMGKDAYRPGLKLWGEMLAKASFDVSINGHTHQFAHLKKGVEGNNFPVIIGGGYSLEGATVIIVQKTGKILTVKVLNASGKVLADLQY